ncbi:MAG TPA: hypothetical protein VNV37_12655 [Solirubrobacteraceae bacterium]|jgi:hypothetical protein|nr:hypothetical protein [Solirubrobacteraceae bacterium]
MADKVKAKDKKGKGKGKDESRGKAAKPGKAADGANGAITLAEHPRAVRAIARAKGWGALLGFLVGGYLSLPTHTLAQAGFRALLAGIVCYVAAWAACVFVWRRLAVAELRGAQHERLSEELAKLGLPER